MKKSQCVHEFVDNDPHVVTAGSQRQILAAHLTTDSRKAAEGNRTSLSLQLIVIHRGEVRVLGCAKFFKILSAQNVTYDVLPKLSLYLPCKRVRMFLLFILERQKYPGLSSARALIFPSALTSFLFFE